MNQTKELLRALLKERRLSLTQDLRDNKSKQIVALLKTLIDFKEPVNLHIYEPILSFGEVDISSFTEYVKTKFPRVDIYTSRKINGEWSIVLLEERSGLNVNLDYIILPMLGFDDNLERIGYGSGYYDQLLSTQPKAQKIGVCFEVGRVKSLPKEDHDMSLDVIVSEKQIYYKNN